MYFFGVFASLRVVDHTHQTRLWGGGARRLPSRQTAARVSHKVRGMLTPDVDSRPSAAKLLAFLRAREEQVECMVHTPASVLSRHGACSSRTVSRTSSYTKT